MLARALLLAVTLAAAACALPEDAEPTPEVTDLRLVEPAAATELVPVPGNTVGFRWTAATAHADDVILAIDVVSTAADQTALWLTGGPIAAGAAQYTVVTPPVWLLPEGPPPPAGVYRLHATAWHDGVALADAWAAGLLVVQGASFREHELTFTADPNARDIWMTTVTATVARAVVYLAERFDAPRLVISDATIASDLAPVGRVVTFTGRTLDDVAIPAGTYQAFVEIEAMNHQRYIMGGLTVHWTP